MRRLLALYSLILFTAHLVVWVILFHTTLAIPEYIPYTPISISGLMILVITLSVFIPYQKKLLSMEPEISIGDLTGNGFLISLFAEIPFQLIRMATLSGMSNADRVYLLFKGTVGSAILTAIVCFFIAFQLKTKKMLLLIGMIMVATFALNWLKDYFGF